VARHGRYRTARYDSVAVNHGSRRPVGTHGLRGVRHSAMLPAGAILTELEYQNELVMKLAWDEYKLLQDKLDKLGDFRFRVKGWAISLGSVLTVGGAAARAGWAALVATLAMLGVFLWMEIYYTRVHSAVGRRLRIVERHLLRAQRQYHKKFDFAAPQLVAELEREFTKKTWLRRHVHTAVYVTLAIGFVALHFSFRAVERPNAYEVVPKGRFDVQLVDGRPKQQAGGSVGTATK
jgi:hypothetical protein